MWKGQDLKGPAKRFVFANFSTIYVAGVIMLMFKVKVEDQVMRLMAQQWGYFNMFLLGVGLILFSVFIGDVIKLGYIHFCLHGYRQELDLGRLFFAFRSGRYLRIVKTLFLKKFYIFLWSLLLLVPGIIKSYEYYFIPYLLIEYPDLSDSEIFAKTRNLSYQIKKDIFVMDLSFIGIGLLSLILYGILAYISSFWFRDVVTVWLVSHLLLALVFPFQYGYYHTTMANLYLFEQEKSLA